MAEQLKEIVHISSGKAPKARRTPTTKLTKKEVKAAARELKTMTSDSTFNHEGVPQSWLKKTSIFSTMRLSS